MIQDETRPDSADYVRTTVSASALSGAQSCGAAALVRRSEVVPRICQVVAEHCLAAFGNRLTSLILTGSAARNEATILKDDKKWRVAGDAEFLVLVNQTSHKDDNSAASVTAQSAKELLEQGIDVAVDLGVVTASYFKELPPHIFSYELRASGKVISGDPDALSLIPDFSPGQLSREDAWRLLCNRMIEQLALIDDLGTSVSELTSRVEYATVKLYLDMATSFLIFAGEYAPTYRERAEHLSRMAARANADVPFPLAKFAARVAECTSWKLSSEGSLSESDPEFWREAISYMRRLWRWEMIHLTYTSGELTVASLTSRLAQRQTTRQRFRAWVSAAKRNSWARSLVEFPRWLRLAARSTPRYLVYQVAADVAFRLPCLVKHSGQPPRLDVNWRFLRDLLPVRKSQLDSSARPVWRQVVDDVLWNYSHLLRNTRA